MALIEVSTIVNGLVPGFIIISIKKLRSVIFSSKNQKLDNENFTLISSLNHNDLTGSFKNTSIMPNEGLVFLVDGKIHEIFSGESFKYKSSKSIKSYIGKSIKSVLGIKSERLSGLKLDLRTFYLSFHFGEQKLDLDDKNSVKSNISISDKVGDKISGVISIPLCFHPDRLHKSIWITNFSGRSNFSYQDFGEKILKTKIFEFIQMKIKSLEIRRLRIDEKENDKVKNSLMEDLQKLLDEFGMEVVNKPSIIWSESDFETKESIIEKEKFNLEVQKIKNSLDIENARTESEIDSLKTKKTSTTNTTIHGSVNTSINNGIGSIPLIFIVMVIFLGIIGVIFLLSNG